MANIGTKFIATLALKVHFLKVTELLCVEVPNKFANLGAGGLLERMKDLSCTIGQNVIKKADSLSN